MNQLSKKITLIRHAESIANAGFATSDHATIPLSVLGYEQAALLSKKINTKPDLIIVSPFLRAKETALPLITKYVDTTVIELDILHEINYLAELKCINTTSLQRKPFTDAYWKKCNPNYIDGEGAENFITFISRVKSFVEYIINVKEIDIIVVGHGTFFKALIYCITNNTFIANNFMMKQFYAFTTQYGIKNSELIFIHIENEMWRFSKTEE